MIAISRDAPWIERLRGLAARGGWEFAAAAVVPGSGDSECALVVLDRSQAGSAPARAVAALRALCPAARIALACGHPELGAHGAAAGIESGADEVVVKEWADARLLSRLSALRDAALADAVRFSADRTLRAERRSRRAYALARGRWSELAVAAAEFALLWRLLSRDGEAVARGELVEALSADLGRDVEAGTVSRRILALRRALAAWPGRLESVRGGAYRLASSRRRSTT